jgi:hypothetical protein
MIYRRVGRLGLCCLNNKTINLKITAKREMEKVT